MFSPVPNVKIQSVTALQPGDTLIIGKRHWVYRCRTEEMEQYKHGQNEWYFEQLDQTGGQSCDTHRVYTQSELEALIACGLMHRKVLTQIEIGPKDTSRG